MEIKPFIGIVAFEPDGTYVPQLGAFLFFPEHSGQLWADMESYLLHIAPYDIESMDKIDADNFVLEWSDKAKKMNTFLLIEPQVQEINWGY